MTTIHQNIEQAAAELSENEIVAIPTETVYGLAGNAFSESAIQKIFAAKERPSFDPLIVHVAKNLLNLSELTRRGIVAGDLLNVDMFRAVSLLMKNFMPGPFTLLLPRGPRIPLMVTSGRPLVGIRSPDHIWAQKILERTSLPLAAPSANRFGKTSPTTPEHVLHDLNGRISSIFDGGPCMVGVESTVAVLNPDLSVSILRPGFVAEEHLKALGFSLSSLGAHQKVSSPGTLDQHYAPEKPLLAVTTTDHLEKYIQKPNFTLIIPDPSIEFDSNWKALLAKIPLEKKIYLTTNHADAAGAARQLFAVLHQYSLRKDQMHAAVTPVLQSTGLWIAIRDRLTRASQREI